MLILSLLLLLWLAAPAVPAVELLDDGFASDVRPFLTTYCLACHGDREQKGELDLRPLTNVASTPARDGLWEPVLEKLEARKMPPRKAKKQPSTKERQAVVEWIRAWRRHEAERNAGDPGPVLARRLSHAEYDYTIRDLTGVDIRPTREFPVDPANEAGFDNSGESLAMSPALLRKYLHAARYVAEHLVLEPRGLAFAPHPVVTNTDRDRYCVRRLVDFYRHHTVDLADYFVAAWRHGHREALGLGDMTLAEVAARSGVKARYLQRVWSSLTGRREEVGPLATVQALWLELPVPQRESGTAFEHVVRPTAEAMRERVIELRAGFRPAVEELRAPGISKGSQSFVLWRNRRVAEHRMLYAEVAGNSGRGDGGDGGDGGHDEDGGTSENEERDEDAERRFCETYPDGFFSLGRGENLAEANYRSIGRLLSAGFHLMHGYFRDDAPLRAYILDEDENAELDRLWAELDFITFSPERQYKDFVFFERAEPPRFMQGAEFDFARSEDMDVVSAGAIERLAEAYLARALARGAEGAAVEAIKTYFEAISARIRAAESARRDAEPRHLDALLTFAERAYRRPLQTAERHGVLAFYHSLRAGGAHHEEAIRDSVAALLVSPHFLYRVDVAEPGAEPRPLADHDLASRLSYFLWSSLPDAELLEHAARGDLGRAATLIQQARRMLRDPRMRRLATEFGGNWLDVRRFEEHNAVDRARFPAFTDELRRAMFEEPIRFFVDLVQNDRSVLEFLYGDHTFVSPPLAKHYGITVDTFPAGGGSAGPDTGAGPDTWVRIDNAVDHARGGLLPMAVFLTKNSPGLRTSPVKRGYWVVRRLLGERIPPPPPDVPELPPDEAKTGDRTLRQLLAAHRDNESCAGCHERFDSIGLAFEAYGPVGERRGEDLGGRPVDTRATFPGGHDGEGHEGAGVAGLRDYLRAEREAEFLDHLSRQLLAYALGRSLILSDEPLLEGLRERLAANGHRFSCLIETIVTSRQFRMQRGRDHRAH